MPSGTEAYSSGNGASYQVSISNSPKRIDLMRKVGEIAAGAVSDSFVNVASPGHLPLPLSEADASKWRWGWLVSDLRGRTPKLSISVSTESCRGRADVPGVNGCCREFGGPSLA